MSYERDKCSKSSPVFCRCLIWLLGKIRKKSQKIAKNRFNSYNSTAIFPIFKNRTFRINRCDMPKNPFATPRTVLQRAKKSLCNRSQFRTLFLPHRFIKIRQFHQRPVSIEFLTICQISEFHKSEQNRKSCGNVRIWRKRAAARRKNHSNLNKSFAMKFVGQILISGCPRTAGS